MRHRYAALLAESRACTNRRSDPSASARPPAPSLFADATDCSSKKNHKQFPYGSGDLTHMDSAVAATMPLEEHSSIDNFQAKSRFKNFLASEGVGTDDQGNKMYIDAAAVCINAEYECNIDESIGKDMLGIDRSDSSCWRPQLPPPALLDYIKLIASKRLQLHAKLNAEKMNQDDNDDDNGKYPPKNLNDLEHALSGSALVAVGILIEELTRDLMVSWNKRNYEANKNYNTQPKEKGSNRSTTSSSQSKSSDHPRSSESDDENDNDNENEIDVSETNSSGNLKRNFHDFNGAGPLGPVSRKNIRIEARLQLQGALFKTQSDKSNKSVKAEKLKKIELEKLIGGKGRNQEVDPGPSVVTAVLLRNRLEVLFGQDLSEYASLIDLVFLQESLRDRISKEKF